MTLDELKTLIGESAGYISVCWTPRPEGVFESSDARKKLEEIYAALDDFILLEIGKAYDEGYTDGCCSAIL